MWKAAWPQLPRVREDHGQHQQGWHGARFRGCEAGDPAGARRPGPQVVAARGVAAHGHRERGHEHDDRVRREVLFDTVVRRAAAAAARHHGRAARQVLAQQDQGAVPGLQDRRAGGGNVLCVGGIWRERKRGNELI